MFLLLDARWPTQIPLEAITRGACALEFAPSCDSFDAALRRELKAALVRDGGGVEKLTVGIDPGEATGEVVRAPSVDDPVYRAQRVMCTARERGEWEQAHTHASLLPFLDEEAAEFAEAVAGGDDADMFGELGDVFLQVLFHAEIARERGAFDLGDVAESFVSKMRVRSPYFFDGSTGVVPKDVQDEFWALGKARSHDR